MLPSIFSTNLFDDFFGFHFIMTRAKTRQRRNCMVTMQAI